MKVVYLYKYVYGHVITTFTYIPVHLHSLASCSCMGVLCCFALCVCLTLLASFFLPSHLSFKTLYWQ